MKKQSAFTLIELLVVIAIIAILAAILFPVFAQAKDAAKDTAILSNLKQVALGNLMYCADADDAFVLSTQTDSSGNFLTWQETVMPYMKSTDIILDTKLPRPSTADPGYNFYQRNSHFGMPLRGAAASGYVAPSGTNPGNWYFGASPRTQKVTNGEMLAVDGILGSGGGAYSEVAAPSLTQTSIDSPASMYMVGQSGNWSMWWGVIGVPMLNFVHWVPDSYDVIPGDWSWAGPHARKHPRNSLSSGMFPTSALPAGATAPADANGVPNGMCIYATADGSGHATDVRGTVYRSFTTSNGLKVCNMLWSGPR